jgi:hypothetical protein
MERSEIRGGPPDWIAIIAVEQRALSRHRAGPARFVAAISGRTHNKDSFAAQKSLPFNDFSHFPNAP